MPRHPRLFLPDLPLHIVQRGHDRQPVFAEPNDFRFYLDNLAEAKVTMSIRVHAYCLMVNHVHLVVTPRERGDDVSRFMRLLAARQTRYTNKRNDRTGTLWEGRFKASPIDSTAYLLACARYVDLNPVRARIVGSPGEYRWSSYRGRAGLAEDPLLDSCPAYRTLGRDNKSRTIEYRAFVARGIDEDELEVIRTAARRNQLTGNDRFRAEIEKRSGRRISNAGPGRPAR